MKNKNKINIAIVGLGNIGSYLYKFLNANIKQLEKKNTSRPNIIFLSAKKPTNKIANPKNIDKNKGINIKAIGIKLLNISS